MLEIKIPAREWWDEEKEEFIAVKEVTLQLEHSLISVSKWEAKWRKSFFNTREPRTFEEEVDYYRCMTINKNVDPMVYGSIDAATKKLIDSYIHTEQTATYVGSDRKEGASGGYRGAITSELVYSWMIDNNIPPEYQKWHLSRLMTLIRVCQSRNKPKEPGNRRPTQSDLAKRSALNARRRAKTGSRG